MLPGFVDAVTSLLSFPRKRESGPCALRKQRMAFDTIRREQGVDPRCIIYHWIPAFPGMTKAVVINCLALVLVIALSGCASTRPSESANSMPVSNPAPALPLPSGDIEEQHQSALMLMEAEDWQGALDLLEPMTDTHPGLSGPWTNLGITRVKLGDSAGAETAFREAIKAGPANDVACNQLGMLYRRNGRHAAAREMYNQGIAANPDNANLHWNLAILYEQYLSEPALALSHFERYQSLTGSDEEQLQRWIVELRELAPAPETLKAEVKK